MIKFYEERFYVNYEEEKKPVITHPGFVLVVSYLPFLCYVLQRSMKPASSL